jgi:ribose transport system substrate-binding protein
MNRRLFALVCGTALAASSLLAQGYLDIAKKNVAQATNGPVTDWTGPTTGPKAVPGKFVVYVASDLKNGGVQGVSQGFTEAANAIGWKSRVLDGQGSVNNQLAALNQAIALKPDGIVVGGFSADTTMDTLAKAEGLGIKLVGWHAVPEPGPAPKEHLFFNVGTSVNTVAAIAADYAIVKSNGHAKAVLFTDSTYPIAIAKSLAIKKYLEQAGTVIDYVDTPLADVAARMPSLGFSLLQKYKDDYQFSIGINDLYFDYIAASFASAHKDPAGPPYNISAGDGSKSAYQRIRTNKYQVATVPEPLNLHGWQLVDELNRALAKATPSGYSEPVHIVTKENIAYDGGPDNVYDPSNKYRNHYASVWGVTYKQ